MYIKNHHQVSMMVAIAMILFLHTPACGQKASWGKMSPMLRQLARQQLRTAESRSRAERSFQEPPKEVCVLLRVKGTDDAKLVLGEYGARELERVGSISIASLPIAQLCNLSLDPRVTAIQSGGRSRIDMDITRESVHAAEAHAATGLPQAFSGRGVMMGIMDIGFDLTHPNFYDATATDYRIERFWDMLSADTVGSTLYVGRDYAGRDELLALGHARDGLDQTHGTHTLGIAAGGGYHSPYRGIAPESRLCIVANAVVDDLPFISEEDVEKYTYATDALGFKYIFDYADEQGVPCVISFSEGSREDFWGYDQLYYELLDNLSGPGHIIVSSAGNKGGFLSWMEKPKGKPSAGTFITANASNALLTLKTNDCDSLRLRFVAYGGETNDTLTIPLADVLACPDSIYHDTIYHALTRHTIMMEIQAYPSCYIPEETCFDVMMTDTLGSIGSSPHLSFEMLGSRPEAEAYCGSFYFRERGENKLLRDAEPSHNINSPASAPSVICVGATSYRTSYVNYQGKTRTYDSGTNGVRAPYSSVGPTMYGRTKPDVMAPGSNIISSYSSYYLENHPDASDIDSDVEHFEFNGRTYSWNSNAGTSMAAPCVGGAIALWLQAKPDLTPEDVLKVMEKTSRHYDTTLSYPNNLYGYGEIDVYAGLLYLLGIDKIAAINRQHTRARTCVDANGALTLELSEASSHPFRLSLYDVSGRMLQRHVLSGGTNMCELKLPSTSKGLVILQIEGTPADDGSTLIRW